MKPANYAPVYAAALYPQWAEIAREHGYALAVHGSLARDFDLICIPWADAPSEPQAVIDAIVSQFAAKEVGGPPSMKPHGRMAYTLSIGFGECFADLSFMPRATKTARPTAEGYAALIDRTLEAEDAAGGVLAAGGSVCGNCDTALPEGCGGIFRDDGKACALNSTNGVSGTPRTDVLPSHADAPRSPDDQP